MFKVCVRLFKDLRKSRTHSLNEILKNNLILFNCEPIPLCTLLSHLITIIKQSRPCLCKIVDLLLDKTLFKYFKYLLLSMYHMYQSGQHILLANGNQDTSQLWTQCKNIFTAVIYDYSLWAKVCVPGANVIKLFTSVIY